MKQGREQEWGKGRPIGVKGRRGEGKEKVEGMA